MKVTLSSEVESCVKTLTEKIIGINPDSQKRPTAIVDAVIMQFCDSPTGADYESLSKRLMTEKGEERALLKAYRSMKAKGDKDAILALRRTLKKVNTDAPSNKKLKD
jgi:hypothetical protein